MSTNEHGNESAHANKVSGASSEGLGAGCCGKCSGGADCEASVLDGVSASSVSADNPTAGATLDPGVVAVVSIESIGGRTRKSSGDAHAGRSRAQEPAREPNVEGLLESARAGDLKGVRHYARACDASLRDEMGRDALMLAAISGSRECVEFLVAQCDPKLADLNGDTALMHAARAASKKCVMALLDVSNALRRNHAGETAWSIAIAKGLVNEVQRTGILPARAHVIVKKAKSGKKASEIAAEGALQAKEGDASPNEGAGESVAEASLAEKSGDAAATPEAVVEKVDVAGVDGDGI